MARKFVREIAGRLGVDDYVAALAASELVTNAWRHAGTGDEIELSVHADPSCWRIVVVDHAPERIPTCLPTPGTCFDTSRADLTNGRGLPLLVLLGGTLEMRFVDTERKAIAVTFKYEADFV